MILCGDCLDVMQTMEDNSIDAIVTDPPYGLKFMNKEWDRGIPGSAYWEEALRVSKPGTHMLVFGGTRTYHRLTCAIEDAGWEIRDCLMWLYGSGFPKSHNLKGKHAGKGTALKPAWEPIIMARKPFPGTVASNVQEWGTGAINIDKSRLNTSDILKFGSRRIGDGIKYGKCTPTTEGIQNPAGRWPANIIHDGSDDVLAIFPETKSIGHFSKIRDATGIYGKFNRFEMPERYLNDESKSASRFFYCAKASPKERGEGNTHPTVKPLSLMKYLIKLITPSGGKVLDPFAGSGSTIIAAKECGFDAIGIEINPDYVNIASSRMGVFA